MKRMISSLLALATMALPMSASDRKEEQRLQNCGTVLREIMDIPKTSPRTLLIKPNASLSIPRSSRRHLLLAAVTAAAP